jgi:CheY-like chemotaxis protein
MTSDDQADQCGRFRGAILGTRTETVTMARVLVIDDDPPVRAAITVVLEAGGFEVVAVEGGRAGQRAVETARFDATIVDVFMPEMDGLETIKALRQRCPEMPIIAMSGAMSLFDYQDMSEPPPDYLSMATMLGAVAAVPKPFQPRELLRAVRESIGRID